jgi:hypothetical protein
MAGPALVEFVSAFVALGFQSGLFGFSLLAFGCFLRFSFGPVPFAFSLYVAFASCLVFAQQNRLWI